MIGSVSHINPLTRTVPVSETPRTAAAGQASQAPAFSTVLKQTAADALNDLQTAEAQAINGLQGKAGTREVVDAVMTAERSMQTALAVRDKLVSAYHELSRMAI